MPDIDLTSSWPEEDINEFQDKYVLKMLLYRKKSFARLWAIFREVLVENPEVFPEKYINANLFYSVFAKVSTRLFGQVMGSTAMIPMADNFNHSATNVLLEMICLPKHVLG